MDKPKYVIDAENQRAEVLGDPGADRDDIVQAERNVTDAYAEWDDDIAQADEREQAQA